jgi:nitroreductase
MNRHEERFAIFLKLWTLMGRGRILNGQLMQLEAILEGLEVFFIGIFKIEEDEGLRIVENMPDVFKVLNGADVGCSKDG